MELKRLYKKDSEGALVMEAGALVVIGVEILHAGPRQKFSPQQVVQGLREGWLLMEGPIITVKGVNESVRYRIERDPGFYCCHCGIKLQGEPSDEQSCRNNSERLKHVATEHEDETSPDPSNPAGYFGINHFDCVREA